MTPAERLALLVATAGLLVLLISFAGLIAIGLGVLKFFVRLTGGDRPDAAGEPSGYAFVPIVYHPDDVAFGVHGDGPAMTLADLERAEAAMDEALRRHGPPPHCPWCGGSHATEQGARVCYELRREGAVRYRP